MELLHLKNLLQKSRNNETCYPKNRHDRHEKNPSLGQCVVTALIIQDYYGGDILFCSHHNHYWNKLGNGEEIDLTMIQFVSKTEICFDEIVHRHVLLESNSAIRAGTKKRYELLKERIKQHDSQNISFLS